MIPKKEFDKIVKALDNGTLRLKILTDEEEKARIKAQEKKLSKGALTHA